MAEEVATIPTVSIDVAKEREKPRLVSLLFFDDANEGANAKVNLMGVFDRIWVNPETLQTHPFGIFIRTGWTFDGEVVVRILDPNGVVVGGIDYSTELPDGLERRPFQGQVLFTLQFNVTVEGLYWFDVSFNGQSIGGTALLVEFKKIEGNKDEHTRGDA